ncbi:hypothetical protein [Enterococcus sp. HY326]|uniref:hypothetical protein n=1 Tax=Enterococcus sp. HY326 TaxID=2971265 RepID=UPI00223FF7B8|nr:hypothetical protein [Enterococcus sp. HY326]
MTNNLANEFAMQQSENIAPSVVASSESSKEMERVKGQIFMAKQYPRNQFQAMNRIVDAMKRPTAAKQAAYSYPRGGMTITGPSIRLAEIVAQNWGNMTYGVRELEQTPGESLAQAYAWDLETNVFVEKTFKVSHTRKKGNSINKVTDPRDIYELVANYGARRLRAAIMEVIPADIFEKALEEADKTLNNQNNEPLQDRLAKILQLFENFDVNQEMLEERFGRKYDSFTERNIIEMGNIYNSLKDGVGKVADFFKEPSSKKQPESNDLEKEFESASKKEEKPAGIKTVKSKVDEPDETEQTELL